MRIDKAAESDT